MWGITEENCLSYTTTGLSHVVVVCDLFGYLIPRSCGLPI